MLTEPRPKGGGSAEYQIRRTIEDSASERGKGGVCAKLLKRNSIDPRGDGAGS
jgi:hypothetical protein